MGLIMEYWVTVTETFCGLFGLFGVCKSINSYYGASLGPVQGTVGVSGAFNAPSNCPTFNSFFNDIWPVLIPCMVQCKSLAKSDWYL